MLYLLMCAAASTWRMLTAYVISVLIALVAGVTMARSKIVERVLLPILDVLQSIPILGFFPAALAVFVAALPPGIGQEAAAIFLIVTSQVWNLIFGVYTSVKSLERSIFDMARVCGLGRAATFFYICVPASRNSLVANSLISWAGGWFFLTSSEVISMGEAEYKLVGLGTYIMEAFERGDTLAFYAGVVTLLTIIMLTYILLWNPAGESVLERRLPAIDSVYNAVSGFVSRLWNALGDTLVSLSTKLRPPDLAWKLLGASLAALLMYALLLPLAGREEFSAPPLASIVAGVARELPLSLARVTAVVSFSTLVSLTAAYVSYRKEKGGLAIILVGEVLASIPAVIWWPLLAEVAVGSPLGPYVVAAVVFLQGSTWYLFFNLLIYGLASMRKEFEEMARVFRVRGPWYLRGIFVPFLMPSLVAGALSAWGGAWNSTIAAEYVELGDRTIDLGGVGALLMKLTTHGDHIGVVVSALVLSLAIVVVNKTFWKRLFEWVESRYGGGVE